MWGKLIITGVCKCGHDANIHHGAVVISEEAAVRIGTHRVPGACLAYGCNELEGLDELGRRHCCSYVDRDDNTRSWWGTVRKPNKRPLSIKFRLWFRDVVGAVLSRRES